MAELVFDGDRINACQDEVGGAGMPQHMRCNTRNEQAIEQYKKTGKYYASFDYPSNPTGETAPAAEGGNAYQDLIEELSSHTDNAAHQRAEAGNKRKEADQQIEAYLEELKFRNYKRGMEKDGKNWKNSEIPEVVHRAAVETCCRIPRTIWKMRLHKFRICLNTRLLLCNR